MTQRQSKRLNPAQPSNYLSYLDGLRAIAIIAVLLFHSNNAWLSGGFLGVEIFFVISGFIISKLLLDEWHKTGTLNVKHFLFRRVRRLVPAAFTVMLATWIYVLIFSPDEINQIFEDLFYGLSFTNNWNYIINERSYFELVGRPRLFEHLWSLSVEFQFYLIWVVFCLVLFGSQRWLACVVVALIALASSYLMAHLYNPDQDPSRVYFGTDTRASALLIGGLLALLTNQTEFNITKIKCYFIHGVSLFSIIGLVLFCIYAKSTDAYLFQGGFLCVSLLTAVVIATCLCTSNKNHFNSVNNLLSSRVFRFIGVRAYGIYLWHWSIFGLTQPWVDVAMDGFSLFSVRILLTAFFSELTYQFIENPIRNGCIERTLKPATTSGGHRKIVILWSLTGLVGCSSLIIATEKQLKITQAPYINGDILESSTTNNSVNEQLTDLALDEKNHLADSPAVAEKIQNNENNSATIENTALINAKKAQEDSTNLPQSICGSEHHSTLQNRLQLTRNKNRNGYINRVTTLDNIGEKTQAFLLGDSVMVGATYELLRRLPCISIDSKVGRQLTEGIQILTERKNKGLLSDVVIIHLGNNSPINDYQMDKVIALLSNAKKIIFINLKLPRNYESENNKLLSNAVSTHSNIMVIDWRSNSMKAKNIFAKDGIHLTGNGAKLYTNLVFETLSVFLTDTDEVRLKNLANNYCITGDCVNGQGVQVYPDGGKYVGDFKNGLSEGQGTLILPNGDKYVGEFKQDRFQGLTR